VCGADGSLAPAGEVNLDALPPQIFEEKKKKKLTVRIQKNV